MEEEEGLGDRQQPPYGSDVNRQVAMVVAVAAAAATTTITILSRAIVFLDCVVSQQFCQPNQEDEQE